MKMITVVIPAAGLSSRFGTANKLLEPVAGHGSLLSATLASIAASCPGNMVVVTGYDDEHVSPEVAAFSSTHAVTKFWNADFSKGMGSSVKAGVSVAAEGQDILIWPADLPFVKKSTVERILALGRPDKIVRPSYLGSPGHPVLFGSQLRNELLKIDDRQGARSMITAMPECVVELTVDDIGVIRDVDSPSDLDND